MRSSSRYILLWIIIVSAMTIWHSDQTAVLAEGCNIKSGEFGKAFLFSPDDKFIVTNFDELRIGVWEVATGELVRTFVLDQGEWISSLDISPDSKYLVAASQTGKVILWDLATGKQIQNFQHVNERGSDMFVEFSPNGKSILTFPLYLEEAILWNPLTGQKLHTLPKGIDPRDWYGFSPSGDYIIIQRWDDNGPNVDIWETTTGSKLKTFVPASTAAISPDNNLVLVNQVGGLILWNISTNTEHWTISLLRTQFRNGQTR